MLGEYLDKNLKPVSKYSPEAYIQAHELENLILELKYAGGSRNGGFYKFVYKRTGELYRVEIHEPHLKRLNGFKEDHVHIYNRRGKSLDKNLNIVDPASSEAHFRVKPIDGSVLELSKCKK